MNRFQCSPQTLRFVGKTALFIESRIIPLIYAYTGFQQIKRTYGFWDQISETAGIVAAASSLDDAKAHLVFLLARAVRFSSIFISIAVIVGLVRKKETPRDFGDLHEILIPLLTVSAAVSAQWVITFLDVSHSAMSVPLLPGTPGLHAAGWSLVLTGRLLALSGILCLGPAFSVFVEVRELVTRGVYRFMNHPIYLGDALSMAGVVIISPSASALLFASLLASLLVIRAILEERALAAYFPSYGVSRILNVAVRKFSGYP